MSMSAFAPSQYQSQRAAAPVAVQLTDEDRQSLQEIHDLINLMLKEIPITTQATARSFVVPAMAPYLYPFFQVPWGGLLFPTQFGF